MRTGTGSGWTMRSKRHRILKPSAFIFANTRITCNKCKDHCCQGETLRHVLLVKVQGVGHCHTQGTERRVAGCDRQHDNAYKGDDAANRSEDVLADNADGRCGQSGISSLQAQVVYAHGAGSPYHGDEALQNQSCCRMSCGPGARSSSYGR